MRDVFRDAVHGVDDGSVRNAINRVVVTEIAAVLVFASRPGDGGSLLDSVANPIDRIALREPRPSTLEKDGPAMGSVGAVVSGITRQPVVALERRCDHHRRLLAHGQLLIRQSMVHAVGRGDGAYVRA